ncbi:MAG: hypothetical protein CL573_05525 [Alphaproteobacteria bacterium]|nr:hypothetical protein [Alphaproteobacteria bacterium]
MSPPATKWQRQGLIVRPDPARWWMRTHAMVPTPYLRTDGTHRLFFSGRNDTNQSHIGWADIALDEGHASVIRLSEEPVLAPGKLGTFDDNGVTPSCVIRSGNETLLYYIGWNPGSTTRMNIFGGLAVSTDDGDSFTRWSEAPILERSKTDPYINTAPFVVADGDKFLMYYVSGVGWDDPDNPRYLIKMANSSDGKNWLRDGKIAINFSDNEEKALARPFVIARDGGWQMWFAHKGDAYRLGYAESDDGVKWERDDSRSGIYTAISGWDSEMVEYGAIVDAGSFRYLFYNGNNYGFDGFGYATSQS